MDSHVRSRHFESFLLLRSPQPPLPKTPKDQVQHNVTTDLCWTCNAGGKPLSSKKSKHLTNSMHSRIPTSTRVRSVSQLSVCWPVSPIGLQLSTAWKAGCRWSPHDHPSVCPTAQSRRVLGHFFTSSFINTMLIQQLFYGPETERRRRRHRPRTSLPS